MFKITHGLLEFPVESTFTHPTLKGLRDQAYKFHQQPVPFLNKLPTEVVNASSVKPIKTLLNANWQSLFPKVPHIAHLLPQPFRLHTLTGLKNTPK